MRIRDKRIFWLSVLLGVSAPVVWALWIRPGWPAVVCWAFYVLGGFYAALSREGCASARKECAAEVRARRRAFGPLAGAAPWVPYALALPALVLAQAVPGQPLWLCCLLGALAVAAVGYMLWYARAVERCREAEGTAGEPEE